MRLARLERQSREAPAGRLSNPWRSRNDMEQIQPHGGKLINRELKGRARDELIVKTPFMERIRLDARAVSDLEMISVGAFSPLQGFMTRADYESVRDHKEL